MHLYFVQHAEAKREEEDPSRGLTDRGTQDIERVAARIAKFNLKVANVFHSGKTRALQTAQLLNEGINATAGISQTDGLSPMDEPEVWVERLVSVKDDITVVGHLPHLEKLASLLLSGDKEKHIVSIQMASIVCLKRFDDGHWAVEWILTPETC